MSLAVSDDEIAAALERAVDLPAWRKGEVVRSGDKFLVRGRALNILKALPDNSVHTAIIDPPWMEPRSYPVAQSGRKSGQQHGERKRSWGDVLSLQEGMREIFDEFPRVCRCGVIVFCGTIAAAAFTELLFPRWPTLNGLVWGKPGGPLSSPPVISAHEQMLWGRRTDGVKWADLELLERAPEGEKQEKGMKSWMVFNAPSGPRAHPVEKPVDLLQRLIRFSTPPGGRVLDVFGGSLSLARAAALEKVGGVFGEMDDEHFRDGLAKFKGGELL